MMKKVLQNLNYYRFDLMTEIRCKVCVYSLFVLGFLAASLLNICHVSTRSDLIHVNFCSLGSCNLLPGLFFFFFSGPPLISDLFQVNHFISRS